MTNLDITTIYDYIFCNKKISVSEQLFTEVDRCYNFLSGFQKGKVIYGINTGFGPMAQYKISDQNLNNLQYNIIRSHSCGAGKPIDIIMVRGAMLCRLYTFLQARSGVHTNVITILTHFLNNNIIPVVPQHGSVGASGDLVQLSHIALALIGEGDVFYNNTIMPSAKAMELCGISPLKMYIREGLALTNGTSVMTGIGLVNIIRARNLINWSILASVMLNEIASSYDDFMSDVLNGLKKHKGQNIIAKKMREISSSSKMLLKREDYLYHNTDSNKVVFKHKVQPYYSLRCIPQILGPILDTIDYTEDVLVNELNSADDNPIVCYETQNIYHGGNFHGDYISLEMDKLKIAITKLTMLAERQINYLFHDKINGILPPFVNLGELGLNYGLQAAQFTATSTTAECQTLSNPMYVHSIPNNNDNQDIVSMGTNAALLTAKVIENSYQVLAIEMIAIVQALDCLNASDKISDLSKKTYNAIREIVPLFKEDTTKYKEIALVIEYLEKNNTNIL